MVGFSTLQNDTSDLMGWQRLIARGTAGFIKTAGILLAAVALILLAGMPTAAHAESIDVTPHPKWLDDFCIGQEQCATGDFNGDGRTDVLAFIRDTRSGSEQGDVYVALSNGSSFLPATKWHDFFCTGSEVCQVGDFNGDGKDDIITFTRSSYTGDATGDVYVALSNGSSFGTSTKWHNYFCIGQEVCNVGDFNGDGKADIISFTRSSYSGDAVGDVYVALSNGHSFGSGAKWHSFFCINQEQCGVGDFNGDGRDDIVSFTKGSSADVFVALSSGSGFGTGNKWNGFFCAGDEVCGVGDFDGDGKDDVVTFLRNGYDAATKGDVYVGLSTGSGFQSNPKWNNYFCIGQEVCGTGDFNGDGRDDVITFLRDTQSGNARGDVDVALAKGTGYSFAYLTQNTYLPVIIK